VSGAELRSHDGTNGRLSPNCSSPSGNDDNITTTHPSSPRPHVKHSRCESTQLMSRFRGSSLSEHPAAAVNSAVVPSESAECCPDMIFGLSFQGEGKAMGSRFYA
jgi:hypothetical protein